MLISSRHGQQCSMADCVLLELLVGPVVRIHGLQKGCLPSLLPRQSQRSQIRAVEVFVIVFRALRRKLLLHLKGCSH